MGLFIDTCKQHGSAAVAGSSKPHLRFSAGQQAAARTHKLHACAGRQQRGPQQRGSSRAAAGPHPSFWHSAMSSLAACLRLQAAAGPHPR